MKETARYILQILVFVGIILSIGTSGYLIIEDVAVSDAFYMAVTAITPTQFDEVHKLSLSGRYFTVVLVFCGFGAVVAFATQFARLVIQSELEGVGVFTRKQMRRRIKQMKNHYIVCGYGSIGGAICAELKDQQLPFVVIADDETSATAINREGHALVRGNPTADSSLREAGIERAIGVIAVLADDSNNLFISLAARELNPQIFIIARGEDSSIEDRILRAGADIVVSPMKLGGRQIAELIKQQAGATTFTGSAVSSSNVLGLGLTAYRHTSENPATVAEILETSSAVNAAAIQRTNGMMVTSPEQDALVYHDDTVVLIKRDQGIETVHHHPTGKTILLADDHRALRLLFARKLSSVGHDVVQAASGEEALRLARSQTPDLIVLDVNMPNGNGYDICAELRRISQFADVPIILYSGEDTNEFVQRGHDCGATMCVRKTSKSSELLASIDQAFSGQADSADASRMPDDPSDKTQAAATGPGGNTMPYDPHVALDNADGDYGLLEELIVAVMEETPRLMEQIKVAISENDYEALRVGSHTLKGSVMVLGASDVTATAGKLEAVGCGNADNVTEYYNQLATQIDELMTALQQRSVHTAS